MTSEELRIAAEAWVRDDPDPKTRSEVSQMLANQDEAALAASFGSRLQFGTAGLRGAMGPGTTRMNRLMVRRVTSGLATYLLGNVDGAARRGVVVAYDGRINSDVFARDVAGVLAAKGLKVFLSGDVVPTPFLSFATTELGASAGVMVTASHNPPEDNGYKVFWGDGAQIIPPHDDGISVSIDAVTEAPTLADESAWSEHVRSIPDSVKARYFDRILALRVHDRGAPVRIVYTAMHGVGTAFVSEALERAGHDDVHLVDAQAEPDGRFPTVRFPNPEEPGAMDLALSLAQEVGADVVLANDPDADRLAVALPDGQGAYRSLSGNQVGMLLAYDLLRHHTGDAKPMVATTIVSTSMLRALAEHTGAAYAETLTGFKWIANRAIAHDAAGGQFIVGFEEALGYSAGSVVRDKDGVSALMLFADLVSHTKRQGCTIWDLLEELSRELGLYVGSQISIKLPGEAGQAKIHAVLDALRASPPSVIGGSAVVVRRDLRQGVAERSDGTQFSIDLPSSNVLAYELADGSRVLVRPSGTEPKLKLYFEVRAEVSQSETLDDARSRAAQALCALEESLLDVTGLERP